MITLNPHSDIQVMGTIKNDFLREVQNLKTDVAGRNAEVEQAKKDYAAGNTDAAKFERQQAREMEGGINASRATLADVHSGALQLKSDFEGRREAISKYKQAEHEGDTQAARQAFQAAHQMSHQVKSDVTELAPELFALKSIRGAV
jgi:hypothetical protein